MMVPVEECYIYENKSSLCEGNHPGICAYIDVAHARGDKVLFPYLTLTGKQIFPNQKIQGHLLLHDIVYLTCIYICG
jgi:hypothetical protein